MKKILRSKSILLLEILLLVLSIWSYFYPWEYKYSWGISMSNPTIINIFLLTLVSTTILAMIERNKLILISNLIVVIVFVVSFVSINLYLEQFLI
jgi:ABC-type transport system involved in multi-copper enzyme maturation permease subunit